MSSEYIKHNGARVKKSSVISRGKKYKYNRNGKLVEIGQTDPDTGAVATQSADDFVIGGTKSSLRRISDLEANTAILYTRLTTADGTTASTSEDSDDVSVGGSNSTTRFKGDVKFEKGIDIKNSTTMTQDFADKVIDSLGSVVDFGTKKLTYSNVYSSDSDLPSASNYHGMFAHVHSGGKALFSHAGNWVELAKQSDLTTAVNNLVASAPGALDTLNELAAAMGDDANFSTTMTNNLAGKASTSTSMTAGAGLTGGGNLSTNRTFAVGGGNGISVSADAVAMSGNYTGSFTATGDVTAYSDENLKYNIETIDGALGKVEGIRGVTWNRKEDDSRATGVVAQELEAVLPEAVHTDAEGMKSVAYGNITGLLVEAVKELSAQVAELKAKK